jgi:hypothetical protein
MLFMIKAHAGVDRVGMLGYTTATSARLRA